MITCQATPNALYCDTDEVLTPAMCALLLSHGIRGVWRYLSGLTIAERDVILASGLELYFVNYSRNPGWIPSATLGVSDGARDLQALRRLGIPAGVHVAFDLEGPAGTPANVIGHVNGHGLAVKKDGYLPALYVGQGPLLNSIELYNLVSVLYWHSCSKLRDASVNAGLEPDCGYAIQQGTPFDVTLSDGQTSVEIDYDFVKKDFKFRLPIGVRK